MSEPRASIVVPVELSTHDVLIQKRGIEEDPLPQHDWSFVSETYEPDEDSTFEECGVRGLEEEMNIYTSSSNLYHQGSKVEESGEIYAYFVYPVVDRSHLGIEHQTSEVGDYKWVDLGEAMAWINGSPFTNESAELIIRVENFLNHFVDHLL